MTPLNTLERVRDFHIKFGCDMNYKPTVDEADLSLFRLSLIQEEVGELARALEMKDPVKVLDALTDLQYVLDGAYLAFGFAEVKDDAFREVHATNMTKVCHELGARVTHKILKPKGWIAPNLEQFIK